MIDPQDAMTEGCPFCQRSAGRQSIQTDDDPVRPLSWVRCICEVEGPPRFTADKAVEAWNTRPAQADMTQDVFVEDAERKLYGRGFINTLAILLELSVLYPNGLRIIKEKDIPDAP